jgi:hypothetical protein
VESVLPGPQPEDEGTGRFGATSIDDRGGGESMGRRQRAVSSVTTAILVLGLAACRGEHEAPGEIRGRAVPSAVVAARGARQDAAVRALDALRAGRGTAPAKQILFGDLHVHTTFSGDAFAMSLPLMQGEGAHPPADACDFARYCSDLDFWSINDHAEALSPQHWRETKESIRQCNAVAGDQTAPDVVAFLGWEWTQVGATPEDHYGHKNVIFREIAEDRVPVRAISARSGRLVGAMVARPPLWQRLTVPLLDFRNRQRYFDFGLFQEDVRRVPQCAEGVDVHELPEDCHEIALTSEVLFEKLSQWGFDTIVIPHGTTWGLYTPPGTTFDKQLTARAHDPGKQILIEVYSGHGNSEEYRDWRAVRFENGAATCPEPTPEYEPCCWRAGEIIRSRCDDPASPSCEQRVLAARRLHLSGGAGGHLAVPGATAADWRDCGQCRDCFLPAFSYRPGSSVQYAHAIRNFDADPPVAFRFGHIASSDNHTARPGTGYKEFDRRGMTEATGPRDERWRERLGGPLVDTPPAPAPVDPAGVTVTNIFQFVEGERQASFFLTGGLVAVHADGRDRDAIWQALQRREVYGTSGDRILLWFDAVDAAGVVHPMGSEIVATRAPRFRVRAVGSFEQQPGCPAHSLHALGAARVERLCRGECYHPGDERRRITAIEVVRIRAQQRPGEPVAGLIEDPWRRVECPTTSAGCAVEVEDPEFPLGGRETIYYARAIQEPSEAVNAGALRCEYDEQGTCVALRPCYGDYRTPFDDDCLGPVAERAWSSPIFVHPPPPAAGRPGRR